MKAIFIILLSFIFIQSCTITERMVVSETGMIDYESEINISEMIGLMYPQPVKDSLREIGQFPIDSTFNYIDADKFFQSNSEEISDAEKDFFKVMDKSFVNIKVDDNKGLIKFVTQQMNVKDFNSYWDRFDSKVMELEKNDPELAKKIADGTKFTSINVKYDGKSFQRITNPVSTKYLTQESEIFGGEEILGMLTYKLEYHFPKPVKKSSIENATFSLDRKTMWVEVPLSKAISDLDKYNFKVEFE